MRYNLKAFTGFHMMTSFMMLLVIMLLGLTFGPGEIGRGSVQGMSVTEIFLTRLPNNILLWTILAVSYLLTAVYGLWMTAMTYGTGVYALTEQFKRADGNESPSIMFKAYLVGLAISFAKVALFGVGGTIHMIAVRILLYNLGVPIFTIILSRLIRIKSFQEWRKLFVDPGTDGGTRMFEIAALFVGACGFLIP